MQEVDLQYTRVNTVCFSQKGILTKVVTFDGIWVPSVSKESPNNNIQKHQRTKSH